MCSFNVLSVLDVFDVAKFILEPLWNCVGVIFHLSLIHRCFKRTSIGKHIAPGKKPQNRDGKRDEMKGLLEV